MAARLRKTTPVLLVGDAEATAAWYEQIGFAARHFPPGFFIVERDDVQIFLQVHPGYARPNDAGRTARDAWDVYIETDDITSLFEQVSRAPGVAIARTPARQFYGQIEFEVVDPNGYVLVFAQPVE